MVYYLLVGIYSFFIKQHLLTNGLFESAAHSSSSEYAYSSSFSSIALVKANTP
jgi:hypothetical protein